MRTCETYLSNTEIVVEREPDGSNVLSINLAELSIWSLRAIGLYRSNPARVSTLFLMNEVFTGPSYSSTVSYTKTGKTSAPQILSERRKRTENPAGRRRDENRRTLNFPDSHPIFGKTSADCVDNVEFCPLFRKQNILAPGKVSGRTEKFHWHSSSSRLKSNERPLPPSPWIFPIQIPFSEKLRPIVATK